MSAHSLYSASGAKKWINCHGALAMERTAPPDTGSHYAREGTAAHFLASEALGQGVAPSSFHNLAIGVGDDAYWVNEEAPLLKGDTVFTVDDDMIREVTKYTGTITALASELDGVLLVEQRLNYSTYLGVPEDDGWGTGDAVIVLVDELVVADLKYGRGEIVDVNDNEQLMLYALGALQSFEDYGDFKTVRLQVHQPRANGMSEVVYTVEELLAFAAKAKAAALSVQLALKTPFGEGWNEAFLNPGEDQCRWCKARATCPALRDAVVEMVYDIKPASPDEFADATPLPVGDVPDDSDTLWLAAAMKQAGLVEHWLKAVRAEVERRLLAGVPVPGQKLVRGKQGNRAWTNEQAAEDLLRKSFRLKAEEVFNYSLISPTQCEKILKDQPKRWSKVEALISRSEGKISVAPETDSRPAIILSAAVDDFDAVSDASQFA